jgi:hypothetical protein
MILTQLFLHESCTPHRDVGGHDSSVVAVVCKRGGKQATDCASKYSRVSTVHLSGIFNIMLLLQGFMDFEMSVLAYK